MVIKVKKKKKINTIDIFVIVIKNIHYNIII